MALLRTARIFAVYAPDTQTSTVLYEVPAGVRAVVRSMDIRGTLTPGDRDVNVMLYTANLTEVLVFQASFNSTLPKMEWRGHLVLEPGDTLWAMSQGIPWWGHGSGAIMPLPN